MKTAIRWLRISYWWGIVADLVMALLLLFPERFEEFARVNFELSADFSYGLRYGLPLMVGWTVLLFWADRRPLERKDVLPITLVPVVAGYFLFDFYSISAGYTTLEGTIPTLVLRLAMSAVFIFSYLNARRAEKQERCRSQAGI